MGISQGMRRGLPHALAAAALAALLGACASPATIQPGETQAATMARLGKPAVERPLPNGGTRLIYTSQPMGQYTWITDYDANHVAVSTVQALTSNRFQMINDGLEEGKWNRDRMIFEFGPPAEIRRVAYPADQAVWGYRFRQDGVWNSLMYVYVRDSDGVVTRFHPGPDPLADPREGFGR
ncbi:hypothetical protein [Pigmentiphaga litoralis]|uniref:hypothetical protein n=1 Tax=Pigmentiphaga litoralis TaxID=516702 RepID=UPI003B43D255